MSIRAKNMSKYMGVRKYLGHSNAKIRKSGIHILSFKKKRGLSYTWCCWKRGLFSMPPPPPPPPTSKFIQYQSLTKNHDWRHKWQLHHKHINLRYTFIDTGSQLRFKFCPSQKKERNIRRRIGRSASSQKSNCWLILLLYMHASVCNVKDFFLFSFHANGKIHSYTPTFIFSKVLKRTALWSSIASPAHSLIKMVFIGSSELHHYMCTQKRSWHPSLNFNAYF